MSNRVALDNVAHQDLRIITRYSAEFGDDINQVMVFPTEFAHVQREYPIFFRRDAEGAFQATALLGFDKGENLFLDDSGWNARYVPAIQQRGPFLIGFRTVAQDGLATREPTIHIDLDHPRVSRQEGEPLFLPHGGNAPALDRANRALQILYHGVGTAKAMFAAFEEAGLIEPVSVNIELQERERYQMRDYYTISGTRLAALEGEVLAHLNKGGFLQAAILILGSLGNVNHLIDLKNRKARQF